MNILTACFALVMGAVCFLEGRCAVCSLNPEIVSREEWGAREPLAVEKMSNPVPFVVIHHSYMPPACSSQDACIEAMQWMQDLHMTNNSWNDIGYSFATGGDNRIYMGRGWSSVGAHAPGYNNRSIGICVIGDWTDTLPPESQLTAVKQLITMGIRQGYIQEDYKLIGHRQARDTECPGEALYSEIQTWSHWIVDPTLDAKSSLAKEMLQPDPRELPDSLEERNTVKRHNDAIKQ